MARCTFCGSDTSGVAVSRCGNCGKSLVARSPATEAHRAQPGKSPAAYDRDQEERDARRVGIISYTVMGIIGLAVIMFMAPHLFGLADPVLTAKDVDIGLSDFEVDAKEEEFGKPHTKNSVLVLHMLVTNRGKVSLKRLDANILARSKDILLAGQDGQTYTLFHLVKPEAPLAPGASVPVDVKFPLLNAKTFGFVKLEWDTKIVVIE